MVRKFLSLAGILGAAAVALAAPASADTVQVGPGFAYDGSDSGGPASVSVILTPPGSNNDTSFSGNAGGFVGTLNGTSAIFWCSDLYDSSTSNSLNYTMQSLVSGQKIQSSAGSTNTSVMTTLTTTTANQLNALVVRGETFVAGRSGTASGNSDQDYASAALQVAIWAFLYNGNDPTKSISNGSGSVFTVGSSNASQITTYAKNFLSCIAGIAQSGVCGTGGWGADGDSTIANAYLPYGTGTQGSPNQKQSFLVATNTPHNGGGGDTPVPEPASMALLGAGLAGLAAFRRRR